MIDNDLIDTARMITNPEWYKNKFCKTDKEKQAFEAGKTYGEMLTWIKATRRLDEVDNSGMK